MLVLTGTNSLPAGLLGTLLCLPAVWFRAVQAVPGIMAGIVPETAIVAAAQSSCWTKHQQAKAGSKQDWQQTLVFCRDWPASDKAAAPGRLVCCGPAPSDPKTLPAELLAAAPCLLAVQSAAVHLDAWSPTCLWHDGLPSTGGHRLAISSPAGRRLGSGEVDLPQIMLAAFAPLSVVV